MHVVLKELFLIAVCNRGKAVLAVFRKQIQRFEKRRKKVVLNTPASNRYAKYIYVKQWVYCFDTDLATKIPLLPQVYKPDYRFSQVSQSRKVLIVTLKLLMQLLNCIIIVLLYSKYLRHTLFLYDRHLKDPLQLKLIYFEDFKL